MKFIHFSTGILFLLIFFYVPANGQVTELKIGDKVPNIQLNKIINYPGGTANLNDFHGMLLILDFWSTTCAPCIQMFEKTDKLQEIFKGKAYILPVTSQREDKIKDFSERRFKISHKLLTSVVEDDALRRLFYFKMVPHYVWINEDGIVIAFTGLTEIREDKIQSYFADHSVRQITMKKRESHKVIDWEKQAFHEVYFTRLNKDIKQDSLENSLRNSDLLFHSVLTRYIEGHDNGFVHNDLYRFTAVNVAPVMLLKLFCALKYVDKRGIGLLGNSKTIYNIKDTTLLYKIMGGNLGSRHDSNAWLDWSIANAICYEMVVPEGTNGEKFYNLVEDDLKRYFKELYNISFKVKDTVLEAYVLKRTSGFDKIKSNSLSPDTKRDAYSLVLHDAAMDDFISEICLYFQNSGNVFVNQTGYDNPIDLDLNCNMHDINSINDALKKYDLQFIKEKTKDKVLFIEDIHEPSPK